MSDTQVLLTKIAAVRERLEKAQAQGPRPANLEIGTLPLLSALVATVPAVDEPEPVHALQESVNRAARHGAVLDGCLRHLLAENPPSPPTSTWRSSRARSVSRSLTPRFTREHATPWARGRADACTSVTVAATSCPGPWAWGWRLCSWPCRAKRGSIRTGRERPRGKGARSDRCGKSWTSRDGDRESPGSARGPHS